MKMRERSIPVRESRECKDPEMGINVACARNNQKVRMAFVW